MRAARLLVPLAPLLALALAAPAAARTLEVRSGESIQAAVERARPGDRVLVHAGVYPAEPGRDAVVRVEGDGLELVGLPGAVLDAEGLADYGVAVGPEARAGCLETPAVSGFRLEGFTLRNAREAGAFLNRVEGFELVGTRYEESGDYGIFPVCSRDGLVAHNHVRGHLDAGIYVGDDDGVRVEDNIATDNTVGIEVENTRDTVLRRNVLHGNTGGVLVLASPGLPVPETRNTEVTGNYIAENNRPNPFERDPLRPRTLLPRGTGLLNIGGDALTVRRNVILQNESFGLATLGNFFAAEDPRLDPWVEGQVVRGNVILRNGTRPDRARLALPPADLIFRPEWIDPATGRVVRSGPRPGSSCFERNRLERAFPEGVLEAFRCP